MPVYCPRCGAQNQDWAQACQQCQGALPQRPAAQEPGYQQPQAQPPAPPPAPSYSQPPAYSQTPYGGPSAYPPQPPGYGFGGAQMGNYASIGKRFLAYLIDGLLVALACIPGFAVIFVGAMVAGSAGGGNDAQSGIGAIVILFGYILIFIGALGLSLYNIYLLGRDGSSLGKRWMGVKVLDPSGQPLGFGKAFLRELVKGVIGNVCFLLLLWPLWDQDKQGLYDKLFSTHVYEK